MSTIPSNVESVYPLSPLQEGLLFHSLSEEGTGAYFNQTAATLRGPVDATLLEQAWNRAVAQHPVLRTFFVWENLKAPIQVVARTAVLPFRTHDWSDRDGAAQDAAFERLRREDQREGFALTKAPLLRFHLIRLGPDHHRFLWSFHHILLDGWSMFRVLGDVFESYAALTEGRPVSLKSSRPFRDHVAWVKRQDHARAQAFWKQYLQGFRAPTPLPEDRPAPTDADSATRPLYLDDAVYRGVQELARRHHLTLNTILQGAFAHLLQRWSGEDDVVFGTVVSGRPADLEGVEDMVGLFINTLPVRVGTRAGESVTGWLKRLQAESAELREYESSPLVQIQAQSAVPAGTPLFDSLFMFENYRKDASLEEMGGALGIADVTWYENVNYPLTALVIPEESRLMLRLLYRPSRFSDATIGRLLGHWQELLRGFVERPDAQPADLDILTAAERQQVVVDWNRTAREYPRDTGLAALFEEQVARAPQAVALVHRGESFTYERLNQEANRLAHRLQAMGVTAGDRVGVCLDRSPAMILALLATLKAGGAYVPLDPEYPADRLSFMFQDTGMHVLLTGRERAEGLPAHDAQVLLLDTLDDLAGESDANLGVSVGGGDLAYVMYTSGSTGRPKGTCIPQRAVARLVKNTDFLEIAPDDAFLQFATISFDASTLEIWGALLNGARLVLFPSTRASLEELGEVIRQEQVTILWLTAGLFHQMVDRHLEGLRGVRQLLAGGDVLSPPHVRRALDGLEGCTLINGYGPTENTTFTCCHRMTRDNAPESTVPIGRPIANTTVYLLDERMRPVPVGVAGELYTGGDGLAREYLNRPELTAERFVADPFAARDGAPDGAPDGARLYRTGDRARFRPDGSIEFLGRHDHQVKVRGYRIELGEIEASLAEHAAVKDSVVVAREDAGGDKSLVAYLVPRNGGEPSVQELRGFLEARLPAYMVPSTFVTLDAFPLNANGKVDRAALPEPEGTRPALDTEYVAPVTDVEKTVADVLAEVLGVESIGLYDNFFDLGIHSLLMIRVHGMLQPHFGKRLKLLDLFQHATVHSLASFLGAEAVAVPAGESRDQQDEDDRKAEQSRQNLRGLFERRRQALTDDD